MELNITLFIQMVHFCIAWYLLRTLFFKPAIAFLTQKHHALTALKKQLTYLGDVTVTKKQQIDAIWNNVRLFSKEHQSQVRVEPDEYLDQETYIYKQEEVTEIKEQHIKAVTTQLKKIIIEGVTHAEL